jgi:hypothetical protein
MEKTVIDMWSYWPERRTTGAARAEAVVEGARR